MGVGEGRESGADPSMALRIPEGGQASDLRGALAGELLEWWCSGSEADQVLFRCD
jgi:hypothetical protein